MTHWLDLICTPLDLIITPHLSVNILVCVYLFLGPYLIVVTRKTRQGSVCGAEIWRILETEIISFSRAEHHLTTTQLEANRK